MWLLQPSVQWFAWETFHPEVIAIVPVLCAYLAAERNKIGWYWIWLVLAIVWKEDLALLFIGLGLLYLIRRRWRLGAATIAVGTLWFAAFAMVMVPHLAGGQTVYGPLYGDLGDSPSEVARTAVTDPGAVASRLKQNGSGSYAVQLMAPMAFTPAGRARPPAVGRAAGDRQPALDRELHVGRALPLRRAARSSRSRSAWSKGSPRSIAGSGGGDDDRRELGRARRDVGDGALRDAGMGAVAGELALPRRLLADRSDSSTPWRSHMRSR